MSDSRLPLQTPPFLHTYQHNSHKSKMLRAPRRKPKIQFRVPFSTHYIEMHTITSSDRLHHHTPACRVSIPALHSHNLNRQKRNPHTSLIQKHRNDPYFVINSESKGPRAARQKNEPSSAPPTNSQPSPSSQICSKSRQPVSPRTRDAVSLP